MGFTRRFTTVIVVIIAIIIGWPQPKLDMEPILNLAHKHCSTNDAEKTTTAATTTTGQTTNSLLVPPLDGIVVVVTGATSGIGLGLTRTLHELGATVVAVGRSASKMASLQEELMMKQGSDGGSNTRIVPVLADFVDLEQVSRAAEEIASKFESIDFLVNNAGIFNSVGISNWKQTYATVQGHDLVFGVNYLSHFLLTEKLLPLLEASSTRNPRIIQMTSSLHLMGVPSDLIPTTAENGTDLPPNASRSDIYTFDHRQKSYSNSKLAQILHARSISRQQQQQKVSARSVCPSWVATDISRGTPHEMLIKYFAFPIDGFGLASTLHAMFQPEDVSTDVVNVIRRDRLNNEDDSRDLLDYAVNVPKLAAIPWFLHNNFDLLRPDIPKYLSRFLDLSALINVVVVLFVQRFDFHVSFVPSLPTSYDIGIQDALYIWSKEAVSEWL